jgi:hypothetical protein
LLSVLGVMSTVLARTLNDGGFAETNQKATAEIDSVRAVLEARTTALKATADRLLQGRETSNRSFLEIVAKEKVTIGGVQSATAEGRVTLDAVKREPIVAPGGSQWRKSAILSAVAARGLGDRVLEVLPPNRLQTDGPSLFSSLSSARAGAYGGTAAQKDLTKERRRAEAAFTERERLPGLRAFSAESTRLAEGFAGDPSPRSQELASALVDDARSARFCQAGYGARWSVAVLDSRGQVVRVPFGGGRLPSGSLRGQVQRWERGATEVRFRAEAHRQRLDAIPETQRNVARFSIEAALHFLGGGRTAFYGGRFEEAESHRRMAVAFLDVALDLAPGINIAKAAYEVVSGRSLVTGAILSDAERTLSAIAVIGPLINQGIKIGKNIFAGIRGADDAAKVLRASEAAQRALTIAKERGWETAAGGSLEANRFGKDLAGHFRKRKQSFTADFTFTTAAEYEAAAMAFARKPAMSTQVLTLRHYNGDWVKMDFLTMEYIVVKKNKNIRTYFKPNLRQEDPVDYYIRKIPLEDRLPPRTLLFFDTAPWVSRTWCVAQLPCLTGDGLVTARV